MSGKLFAQIGLTLMLAVLVLLIPGLAAGTEQAPTTAYLPLLMRERSLVELISVTNLSLSQPLAGSAGSFCTWDWCTLGPRLYHEPLPDDSSLLGWTDQDGNGHASLITGAVVQNLASFAGREVRGMVAHGDGSFALILWDPDADQIWLSRRNANGSEVWTSNLNSSIAVADFWLGDGRLSYGGGLYAAYFTVKGVSGGFTGHHGDQLSYVDDSGVIQTGLGWDWGCSHSMAELVSYHPGLGVFAPLCSSDCYPGKGLFVNNATEVYAGGGDCGGMVSVQLGQMALGETSWKLLFNALDRPCCTGRGIGLATIDGAMSSSTIWLTQSDGRTERDPVIGRLGTGGVEERYLVGWMTSNNNAYWMGVIDGAGDFQEGPVAVSASGVEWGQRDDSLRTRYDGTVSWVRGEPNSSQLKLYRFDGARYLP